MIIDYDHNQNLNTDRKLDSLKESVQMALNENDTDHRGFRALFDKVNSTISSIQESLTNLLTLCNGAIIARDVSGSGTIGASTNGAITFTLPTISGYTYVGIVGIRNSHGANFPITDFDAANHRAVIRNLTTTQTTVTLTARLLFVKNGIWGGIT